MPSHTPGRRAGQLIAFDVHTSKWTMPVLMQLRGSEVRFGVLRAWLDCVSNKTLSATLRHLERDGLVGRKVHPSIPPRVDYWLTPLGEELAQVLAPIAKLAERQRPAIKAARQAFDAQGNLAGGARRADGLPVR